MTELATWIVIGMLLAGCQSNGIVEKDVGVASRESEASDQGQVDLLRTSFADCVNRSTGVTPEMQDCIDEEYVFQEARMEDALAKLPLTEHEQQLWREREEGECSWDAETEGQAQRLEANYCSLERIAKRANELEAKLGL